MMQKKINWGIIGLGNIAYQFSIAIEKTQNAKLIAVASKDDSNLKKFQKRFKIEKNFLFSNYEKILDCEEVDIVYIALPNSLHKNWILNSFKYKKNVLVEKPAVMNLSEINEVRDFLNLTNLFFSEAFMYRYLPQIKFVLDIIKENKIGDLLSMRSYFGVNLFTKKKFFFFNKKKRINPNSRLFNKELGGGCILDLGCYTTSFSLLIASLINKKNLENFRLSNVTKEIGETGVDIESSAEIIFLDGFKSKILASFKNNLGNMSEIVGKKGRVIINDTWKGSNVILRMNNEKDQNIQFESTENIYSRQIREISHRLLLGSNGHSFPVMSLNETLTNTKMIENWLNY